MRKKLAMELTAGVELLNASQRGARRARSRRGG